MPEFETYTIDGEFLTVDLILWRRYRRPTPGMVERTLDVNPGLANQGPFLTVGTTIKIPYPPPAMQRSVVRLWT